jgi:hypothetical protein
MLRGPRDLQRGPRDLHLRRGPSPARSPGPSPVGGCSVAELPSPRRRLHPRHRAFAPRRGCQPARGHRRTSRPRPGLDLRHRSGRAASLHHTRRRQYPPPPAPHTSRPPSPWPTPSAPLQRRSPRGEGKTGRVHLPPAATLAPQPRARRRRLSLRPARPPNAHRRTPDPPLAATSASAAPHPDLGRPRTPCAATPPDREFHPLIGALRPIAVRPGASHKLELTRTGAGADSWASTLTASVAANVRR